MNKPPFQTAIVGCGKIAGSKDTPKKKGPIFTHAQAYRRNPNFKIAWAVDNKKKNLSAFMKKWGIAAGYGNLKELLEKNNPQVISLCTPNQLHAAQIKEILRSGNKPKIIFAEKPLCLREKELKDILETAKDNACKIIVNHTRRFDPGHIKLKNLIREGELGKFIQGRCAYYGGWLNNGCHLVDTLRMLLNKEPSVKSAVYGAKGRGKDTCLDVELLFAGAPVEIKSFDEKYYQISETELRFEKGRIVLQDFGIRIIIERVKINNLGERILVPDKRSPIQGLKNPLEQAVRLIAGYLEKGREIEKKRGISLEESYKTMTVLWKALKLSKGRKK